MVEFPHWTTRLCVHISECREHAAQITDNTRAWNHAFLCWRTRCDFYLFVSLPQHRWLGLVVIENSTATVVNSNLLGQDTCWCWRKIPCVFRGRARKRERERLIEGEKEWESRQLMKCRQRETVCSLVNLQEKIIPSQGEALEGDGQGALCLPAGWPELQPLGFSQSHKLDFPSHGEEDLFYITRDLKMDL